MKLSPGKSTLPGQKQVFRRVVDGVAVGDVIGGFDETCEGRPLLAPVMRKGKRLEAPVEIDILRQRAARLVGQLPADLRGVESAAISYPVAVSERLRHETTALRERLTRGLRD
jgi:nicotinate phosphoribosyltransferase